MSMIPLSQKDLEKMKTHKYTTTGYSWLDNHMNPYWTFCASLLPYKFSPNMVTLTGFICQSISIIIIAFYDLTLQKKLPPFLYILFAILMFLAQTFDAIDGKHARNTKRSSSLGQLMDHGCDAMSNYILVAVIAQAHCFGPTIYTLLLQFGIQSTFYVFTLEEHFSGVLRTNMDNLGVTEYQFLAMAVVALPAFIGQFFSEYIIFGYSLANIILVIVFLSGVKVTVQLILTDSKDLKDGWQQWNPALSYYILSFGQFLTCKLQLYQKIPLLIVVLNGFYFGFLASKLIIDNMSERPLRFFDLDVFVFVVGIVVAVVSGNAFIEGIILILLSLWVLVGYYIHIIGAVKALLNYLNIPF